MNSSSINNGTENVIKKGYVDCVAGQIHYRFKTGEENKTPIVWLHQTASSSAMYEKVFSRLTGLGAMYALDTPGFGGSFDPDNTPIMRQYAEWLVQACDNLGIGEFHVFGHHTGGCLLAEMAVAHPERVKSAMMIGPVPLTKEEREGWRGHFPTPLSPNKDGAYLKQTWDSLVEGANHDIELHHREVLDTLRAYMGRYNTYNAVWDQDFVALYEKITCPILIMCAKDDVLWPFFERAQTMRPDAVAAIIKGANFEPDLDPDGVSENVRKFLASIA